MTTTNSDLENRRCDSSSDCGLTGWACNRLQDMVYSDDRNERRKLAIAIREDMYEYASELHQALLSGLENLKHDNEDVPSERLSAQEDGEVVGFQEAKDEFIQLVNKLFNNGSCTNEQDNRYT